MRPGLHEQSGATRSDRVGAEAFLRPANPERSEGERARSRDHLHACHATSRIHCALSRATPDECVRGYTSNPGATSFVARRSSFLLLADLAFAKPTDNPASL